MDKPMVKFYPVGNGDMTLIRLGDGTTVLIDCNVTEASTGDDDDSYDVKADLFDLVNRDGAGRPHVDVFILTHPDQDHCRGLETVFWLGDPADRSVDDPEDDTAIIDELWFAPRIFTPHETDLCEEAKAFRSEARRRMEAYRSGGRSATAAGNRIRVIGYSENPELSGMSEVLTVPGNTLDLLNGTKRSDFHFLVLAPVKKDIDNRWSDRNDTSIVLLAEFGDADSEDPVVALFGGDAECAIWERIWDLNAKRLPKWDLLLAPHHCSWTFFSENKHQDDPTPNDNVVALLAHHHKNAVVVASCKPIKDDDDNPPHYQAVRLYKNQVGEDNFLCTADCAGDTPEPITFAYRRRQEEKKVAEAFREVFGEKTRDRETVAATAG